MWDGDHRPLSMAIQYVVMLKTQDIRPWMNDGPLMDDEYPQPLRQAIRREWPGQSIQHIRLGFDRDRKVHGFRSRGMWCLLFDATEARAGSRTSISDLHRRNCLVDTKDLQALRNALDGLGTQSAGHPALLPVNIASRSSTGERWSTPSRQPPRGPPIGTTPNCVSTRKSGTPESRLGLRIAPLSQSGGSHLPLEAR